MDTLMRQRGPCRRILATVLLSLASLAAAAASEPVEYAVKAAYLYKFGLFVDWPAQAFATSNSPLTLCVMGEDPFGSNLDSAVAGQRIGEHPVVTRRLKSVARDSGCHILFVAGDSKLVAAALEAVRGSPVLTVTDSRNPPSGVVNFVIKDNRVRFDLDEDAAAHNGLSISSKLLSLAVNVRPRK